MFYGVANSPPGISSTPTPACSPFRFLAHGSEVIELESCGCPLNLPGGGPLAQGEAAIKPGGRLLLVSDGVLELRGAETHRANERAELAEITRQARDLETVLTRLGLDESTAHQRRRGPSLHSGEAAGRSPMPNGHVTHAEKEGFHVLRYFGRVDYMLATSINRFADRILEKGAVGGLIFDLTEAENLDSTNLGLLARIAERVRRPGVDESVIVSTSDNINCVLASMCFDQIFEIVTDPADFSAVGADEIEAEPQSQEELLNTMLDAHRTLVSLSESDRLQFQDVVACLESELKTKR